MFACFFAAEAVLKMSAFGLFGEDEGQGQGQGQDGYFRNVWNRLDFVIAVLGMRGARLPRTMYTVRYTM